MPRHHGSANRGFLVEERGLQVRRKTSEMFFPPQSGAIL